MKDDLLSAPVEGGREILSGLAAWLAGLTWGYALLTGDMLWELRGGEWMVGWLGAVFLPPGMSGWGWLALPFELVMLYGAAWRGWNACLVIGLLALAAGLLALSDYGPWYLLRLILPLVLVLFGIAVERGWFIPRRRLRPPARGIFMGGILLETAGFPVRFP
jgi:hypothetical protein